MKREKLHKTHTVLFCLFVSCFVVVVYVLLFGRGGRCFCSFLFFKFYFCSCVQSFTKKMRKAHIFPLFLFTLSPRQAVPSSGTVIKSKNNLYKFDSGTAMKSKNNLYKFDSGTAIKSKKNLYKFDSGTAMKSKKNLCKFDSGKAMKSKKKNYISLIVVLR